MSQINGAIAPEKHFENFGLRCESYPDFLTLPKERRLEISTSVIPLTGKGFMRFEIDEELTTDVNSHVAESPRLNILYNQTDEPQAFLCTEISEWSGYTVFNLHGIIIDPIYQGKGLGFSMILQEVKLLQPEIMILTTQNINMYKLAQRVCFLSNELAVEMAPTTGERKIEGQVAKGIYRDGNSLYGDVGQFTEYAIPEIDWQSGDALVVAGFIRKSLL